MLDEVQYAVFLVEIPLFCLIFAQQSILHQYPSILSHSESLLSFFTGYILGSVLVLL